MFVPASIVARIDASVFFPETVKVNMTEKGLAYGIKSEDGTWLTIYDNRPVVRISFEEVLKASDYLDIAERVKNANRCKSNIVACNDAFGSYQAAVANWKTTLSMAGYVRIREHQSGYLFGIVDEPRKGSVPWAMFRLSFDGKVPEGVEYSQTIGNIVVAFVRLKKTEESTPVTAPVTETTPIADEGVTSLAVGPEAEAKAEQPVEIDMAALAKEQGVEPELLGVEADAPVYPGNRL